MFFVRPSKEKWQKISFLREFLFFVKKGLTRGNFFAIILNCIIIAVKRGNYALLVISVPILFIAIISAVSPVLRC